jgi:REP element-mobilizing transposase RayT
LNIEGASYHVMARGNRKQIIFESDRDRTRFLEILSEAVERYAVLLLGHSLMGNHFHLVVTTPRGNLSAFMRQVDGTFTQYSNWCHQRVGHLLQGPFKAVLIEDDIHLLTALAYVLMNPVDAGLCASPSDWAWSSYRATAGLTPVPPALSIEWLDRLFPTSSREESQRRFGEFMQGARNYPSYLQLSTPAVGSDPFRERIRSYIGDQMFAARVPRSYKSLFRPALEELFRDAATRAERKLIIQRAHVVHGYRLSEIARSLGMHPASVSRILCSVRRDGRRRVEEMLKNGT